MSTSRTVARNSIWYGVEMVFITLASVVTSLLVARHFGPERLGDYSLAMWLSYVAGALGSVGIPLTTRKYMAEYFGKDDELTAFSIFRTALKIQLVVALGVTLVVAGLVWVASPPDFRPVALCMAAGIFPRLIGFIPSQVNMARENAAANVPGAVAGGLLQVVLVLATLLFGWDLLGLAAAQMAGNTLEMAIKMRLVSSRAFGRPLPPLPPELRARMLRFSTQGLGLVLLNLFVFDRSGLIMLKLLNADAAQRTYFSLCFTLLDRLLMAPQSLAGALNVTMMTMVGRDESRLAKLTSLSMNYLLLLGLPLLGGAIALSVPVWSLYGKQYDAAVPVFSLMLVFGVSRLFIIPPFNMLQATENQGFILWWGVVCAAVNVTMDYMLVADWGAFGAVIGNGTCHTLMALGVWFRLWTLSEVRPDFATVFKLAGSTIAMALCAAFWAHRLPGVTGVAAAVVTGVVIYLAMLRLTAALGPEDRDRFGSLAKSLPQALRSPFERLLFTLVPEGRRAQLLL